MHYNDDDAFNDNLKASVRFGYFYLQSMRADMKQLLLFLTNPNRSLTKLAITESILPGLTIWLLITNHN